MMMVMMTSGVRRRVRCARGGKGGAKRWIGIHVQQLRESVRVTRCNLQVLPQSAAGWFVPMSLRTGLEQRRSIIVLATEC